MTRKNSSFFQDLADQNTNVKLSPAKIGDRISVWSEDLRLKSSITFEISGGFWPSAGVVGSAISTNLQA
jgi:hypothetical protein